MCTPCGPSGQLVSATVMVTSMPVCMKVTVPPTVLPMPNGAIVADQFWWGNAAQTYDEILTDSRFNIDIGIRRDFAISSYRLEFGLDVINVLNHTQFSGAYTGGLGGTVTAANPALGLVPGMGNSTNYGTRGMATYNPRQMMARATFRF